MSSMAKVSSVSCFCTTLVQPSIKNDISSNRHHIMQVRAQSFDEGRSRNNMVDSNLRVLTEKMEVVRMKERLERCCRSQEYGWNYAPGYNSELRRAREVSTLFEIVRLVCFTLGFTTFGATLCLVLASILVHVNR